LLHRTAGTIVLLFLHGPLYLSWLTWLVIRILCGTLLLLLVRLVVLGGASLLLRSALLLPLLFLLLGAVLCALMLDAGALPLD